MGVAGCGKNAVGEPLAVRLGFPFFDGDDFHTAEARQQMADGIPLTEKQRVPWRQRLGELLDDLTIRQQRAVLACSCLSRAFRNELIGDRSDVLLVYLEADLETLAARLEKRADHYFKADLLPSQFEALEEPEADQCLRLDARARPEVSIDRIIEALSSTR